MEAHLTKAQRRKRENRELIRRMYLAGSSREEIAEAAGYAVGTVCEYLSDMGMLRRQDDRKRLEKMLRLHDEGKSLKEIGAEVGLSIGRVSAVLGKNGRRRVMDYGTRDRDPAEDSLVSEDTIYADNTPKIYCYRYQGKEWTDITELIARR